MVGAPYFPEKLGQERHTFLLPSYILLIIGMFKGNTFVINDTYMSVRNHNFIVCYIFAAQCNQGHIIYGGIRSFISW